MEYTPKRKYVAIVVPPHGQVEVNYHDKQLKLEELQKYVGGTVQEMPFFTKIVIDGVEYRRGIAYCDEDGFQKRLELNERAHSFWRKACPKGNPERMTVVGPILFTCLEPKDVTKSERLSRE